MAFSHRYGGGNRGSVVAGGKRGSVMGRKRGSVMGSVSAGRDTVSGGVVPVGLR